MSAVNTVNKSERVQIQPSDIKTLMDRFSYSQDIVKNIENENLIPGGLLSRLHNAFPHRSGILETKSFMFKDKAHYAGLKGFREIIAILKENGVDIGFTVERELFIKVYRFMATKHVLNTINWDEFETDSLFQLVFPQPGMIRQEMVDSYKAAKTDEEKENLIKEYMKQTNPHDGKQKLNKPYYEEEDGTIAVVEGSQHKYPQCKLIFDKTTQSCFAFCSYCFRHAQVRGDEDMFIQKEVEQVHHYIRQHKEITDVLITGGDASYMPYERMKAYAMPFITDPEMDHIKTLRLGTRVLTFDPELILTKEYENILGLFKELTDNGIQVAFMSHFSTPREVLNISTIAAIRRLRATGVTVKSQSPVMNHISLFTDENGEVDVDKSAQNWIDLGHVLGMLTVGFHSMYCARPTGEHHYFTVPLKNINEVFSKIYRSLPSISRPSRYITMTSSAGKISMLGVAEVKGEKVFALKFNESRNMEWMDKVYLAKYDEVENTIANLKPLDTDKHFFEDELEVIENKLEETFIKKMEQNK
jgi:L-lysine 2,3-aminomutase